MLLLVTFDLLRAEASGPLKSRAFTWEQMQSCRSVCKYTAVHAR